MEDSTDWKERAETAEKRIQKIEMQLVNIKRRAETAESRTEILSKQVTEAESKLVEATSKATAAQACADAADNLAIAAKSQALSAEKRAGINDQLKNFSSIEMTDPLKAALERASSLEKRAEAAGRWATDAMEKQADAEKRAKAAEDRAIAAQKQASLAINEITATDRRANDAGSRMSNFQRQIQELKGETAKWKLEAKTAQARLSIAETEKIELESDCANLRNRALAAESRVQGLISHLRNRTGQNISNILQDIQPGGKKNNRKNTKHTMVSNVKKPQKENETRNGMVELNGSSEDIEVVTDMVEPRRIKQKKRSADEKDDDWSFAEEYVTVPIRKSSGPKMFRCSNCKYSTTRKPEHERHVRKCITNRGLLSTNQFQKKHSDNKSHGDHDVSMSTDSRPRTRRTAATTALESIQEGDQSWQGLMLDNKGITPGVAVPIDIDKDEAAGFDEKDEETFLAAEAQELFGDILNGDNALASGAEMQFAEDLLNNWENELPDDESQAKKPEETPKLEQKSKLGFGKDINYDTENSKDNNNINDTKSLKKVEENSKAPVKIPLMNRSPSSSENNNNHNISPGPVKRLPGPKSFQLKRAESMQEGNVVTPSKIQKLSIDDS